MLRLKRKHEWETPVGQWQTETPFQDKTTIEGLSIFLAGFQATHSEYGSVTGSAAEIDDHPTDRAWYELVERITILESIKNPHLSYSLIHADGSKTGRHLEPEVVFPSSGDTQFEFSKSNGVALHRTYEEACRRAAYEMVERDLVLRSWIGLIRPIAVMDGATRSRLSALKPVYDIKRVHFAPKAVSGLKNPVSVSIVALLPKNPAAPLIVAFGAAESPRESLLKAEGEALQRLGFLWDEEIPIVAPDFSPTNLYHQDYHLMVSERPAIEAWLNGEFFQNSKRDEGQATFNIEFIDLTLFDDLGLKVAKAYCPEAIPLVFGKWREREFKNLPESRRIHPIA